METTEITETVQTAEQENNDIAIIAKASIANIEANKKAYEELRDKYKGTISPDIKDPEFKATHKLLTQGSGALVKARTAATKLGKQETDKLDKVKVMIKSAVEDLIAITAETEKEVKSEKERADQMIDDEKQEQLRQLEEKKQVRIAKLFELGLKFNGAYYEIGDLNITSIQVIQYSEAQFEGFVSQATVAYEAEQLRIAEEEAAEAQRLADEKAANEKTAEANRKAQELLTQQNEAKQKELDAAKAKQKEQDDLIASLQAQIKAQEALQPPALEILPSADIKPVEALKNGHAIKFTDEQRDSILHDVLVTDKSVKGDEPAIGVTLLFSVSKPYIDTPVGKSTMRIYVEQFLDEAQDGLQIEDRSAPNHVKATGEIGTELLFIVFQ